jgi:glycosyltransferase involved in cell wall biosynthesis
LPDFYSIADIFVLPSGTGETWGLVVNEAMNFGLPVIVSDIVGCSSDLVHCGRNGFVFKMGDINELSQYLKILIEDDNKRIAMGKASIEIVSDYNYEAVVKGIKQAVEKLLENKDE